MTCYYYSRYICYIIYVCYVLDPVSACFGSLRRTSKQLQSVLPYIPRSVIQQGQPSLAVLLQHDAAIQHAQPVQLPIGYVRGVPYAVSLAGALASMKEDTIRPRPKKPVRPSDPFNTNSTLHVVAELLGADVRDVKRISSASAANVRTASDLSCGFDTPCCWHNIGDNNDDLDWALYASSNRILTSSFGVIEMPVAPFAAAASRKTHSLTYGTLVSCPIQCQKGDAILTFDHWTSDDVALDVCTLTIEDSRKFTYCKTVKPHRPIRALIKIPKQDKPFVIVIVASEFTEPVGGIAAIDNIRYSGVICHS